MSGPRGTEESADYYDAYCHYNQALRTWLLSYGVAAPVLLATQDKINARLQASGIALVIVSLFLAGVLFQVLIALINKTTNWLIYQRLSDLQTWNDAKPETRGERPKITRSYRRARIVSNWYWLDLAMDIGTVLLFAAATVLAVIALQSQ